MNSSIPTFSSQSLDEKEAQPARPSGSDIIRSHNGYRDSLCEVHLCRRVVSKLWAMAQY